MNMGDFHAPATVTSQRKCNTEPVKEWNYKMELWKRIRQVLT
jgi:hypothetical protein